MDKNKGIVNEIIKVAVISGWVLNFIYLAAFIHGTFALIAYTIGGFGGIIFLFNIFTLALIIYTGQKRLGKDTYIKNIILIIAFLIVYLIVFDKEFSNNFW